MTHIQTTEEAFQIAFNESVESMIKTKMAQTAGMSYSDALRAVQIEQPDFFKDLEYTPSKEKIFQEKFSDIVTKGINALRAGDPTLSYSEALVQVQKLSPEIFTDWISMN